MKTDGKTSYVLKQGDAKFAEAVPVEIWCAFASTKAYKVTLTIQRDSCQDSDTTIVNLKSGPWLNIPNPLFQCMDGPSGTATVPFNIFGTEDVDYRLSTDNPLCAMVYGGNRISGPLRFGALGALGGLVNLICPVQNLAPTPVTLTTTASQQNWCSSSSASMLVPILKPDFWGDPQEVCSGELTDSRFAFINFRSWRANVLSPEHPACDLDPTNDPWDDVDGIDLRIRCDIGGFLDNIDRPLQLGLQSLRRSCFGGNCQNTGCTKRGYIPFTYKKSPPLPIPDPPRVCSDPLVKTPVTLPYILPGGADIGDILDFKLDAALKNCKIFDTDGTTVLGTGGQIPLKGRIKPGGSVKVVCDPVDDGKFDINFNHVSGVNKCKAPAPFKYSLLRPPSIVAPGDIIPACMNQPFMVYMGLPDYTPGDDFKAITLSDSKGDKYDFDKSGCKTQIIIKSTPSWKGDKWDKWGKAEISKYAVLQVSCPASVFESKGKSFGAFTLLVQGSRNGCKNSATVQVQYTCCATGVAFARCCGPARCGKGTLACSDSLADSAFFNSAPSNAARWTDKVPIKVGGGTDCNKGLTVGDVTADCSQNVLTLTVTNTPAAYQKIMYNAKDSKFYNRFFYVGCAAPTVCGLPSFGGNYACQETSGKPWEGGLSMKISGTGTCHGQFPMSSNDFFADKISVALTGGCTCQKANWIVYQDGPAFFGDENKCPKDIFKTKSDTASTPVPVPAPSKAPTKAPPKAPSKASPKVGPKALVQPPAKN